MRLVLMSYTLMAKVIEKQRCPLAQWHCMRAARCIHTTLQLAVEGVCGVFLYNPLGLKKV